MRDADDIWNRACTAVGMAAKFTSPGDRALVDMLLMHSLAMNGGVLHAVETCRADERLAAVQGFRYFGLNTAADIIEETTQRWSNPRLTPDEAERLEFEANERYTTVVEDDEVLVAAFEARFQAEPSAFDTDD